MRPLELSRRPALDDGNAFIPDSRRGPLHLTDDDADAFAEEFLAAATSGEEIAEDARNEVLPDELALGYVETDSDDEREEGELQ